MHTPDQTHKERLYLDINLQLMQKNVPEIKWLIVLLVKEVKKYFKSEKEEIEQSEVICGGVSVVFVSTEEEKIKNKLKKLQDKNPEKFYMEYVTPLDVDLTSLEHYPSIEISKNDLQ